jgi:hypothetical protein
MLAVAAILMLAGVRAMRAQQPEGFFQLFVLTPLVFGFHILCLSLAPARSLLGLEMADWTFVTWITTVLAPSLVLSSGLIALRDFWARQGQTAVTHLGFCLALASLAFVFGRHWPEAITAMAIITLGGFMVRQAVARAA